MVFIVVKLLLLHELPHTNCCRVLYDYANFFYALQSSSFAILYLVLKCAKKAKDNLYTNVEQFSENFKNDHWPLHWKGTLINALNARGRQSIMH